MKDEIMRSPLFYVGDKYKLMREIRTYFPSNIGRFIEPFVGGGSVFMNTPAQICLANDIDQHVISLHKLLSGFRNNEEDFFTSIFEIIKRYGFSLSFERDDVPPKLKDQYPKTYYAKFNREAYARLKEDFNKGGQNDMMQLYILLIYGFNRMLRFNKEGYFNLPVGNVDFNQNTYDALVNYFRIAREKTIHFTSCDFRHFLNNIHYDENDFVYLDPPYLITFSEYNKLWNKETETDLLNILNRLNDNGIRFAISNVTHYKGNINEIFTDWASQYNVHPIKSNYISYHDNTIKQFNEVLVTNY